jgi:hypothetical protein
MLGSEQYGRERERATRVFLKVSPTIRLPDGQETRSATNSSSSRKVKVQLLSAESRRDSEVC